MSKMMRAAAIDEFGPADVLRVRELPRPTISADEVLVQVMNAGVQVTDAAIRAGWAPPRRWHSSISRSGIFPCSKTCPM